MRERNWEERNGEEIRRGGNAGRKGRRGRAFPTS